MRHQGRISGWGGGGPKPEGAPEAAGKEGRLTPETWGQAKGHHILVMRRKSWRRQSSEEERIYRHS